VADAAPKPLAAELGIAEGSSLVVLAFFAEVAAPQERIETMTPMVFPAGALWIGWPTRGSGMATDMTDDGVSGVALPFGLGDNKVCAIDDTWTGLRLVWCRDLRGDRSPSD
jgi:hypothetical protein